RGAQRLAARGEHPLAAEHVLGGRGQDGSGDVGLLAAVVLVAARRRQVGLLVAVVGVVGLARGRADRRHRDDALGLRGDVDAGVVDLADALAVGGVVGAGRVGLGFAEVGGAVAEGADQGDAPLAGVVDGALHAGDDTALLELFGFGVG